MVMVGRYPAARHTKPVPWAGRSRWTAGTYLAIGTALTTAALAVLAGAAREPFMFPSLGPTIFILFFAPLGVQAAPRNVILGQGLGLACGYFALLVFGLSNAPADVFDLSWSRIGSVTLALTLTSALMVWSGFTHAPAGATTLIVALGLVHTLPHLGIMVLAILLVVAIAFIINRLAGFQVPLWSPRSSPTAERRCD